MDRDIKDAVTYYALSYRLGTYEFNFNKSARRMPVTEIMAWDDYSDWGQWDYGELASLQGNELLRELTAYRGSAWAKRALAWIKAGKCPPIVLVKSRGARCVGDGRSRISVAYGMRWTALNVIILDEKQKGKFHYTFYPGKPKHESLLP